MQHFEKLGLHSHIIPAFDRLRQIESDDLEEMSADEVYENLTSEPAIFDCRGLDRTFVEDTGDTFFEECQFLRREIRLPYKVCYFELTGFAAVIAKEVEAFEGALGDSQHMERKAAQVMVKFLGAWNDPVFETAQNGSYGYFANGYSPHSEEVEFFELVNTYSANQEFTNVFGAKLVLGILSLLSEKLIADTIAPDPAPALNRARAKRGKLPVSAETHVLSLNIAAVRKAVRNQPLAKHESPCLHWRRGHQRVLHRGSEFEAATWVNRCLVGDPEKGYRPKQYRVKNAQPMFAASA